MINYEDKLVGVDIHAPRNGLFLSVVTIRCVTNAFDHPEPIATLWRFEDFTLLTVILVKVCSRS
jgi:hypothetical protein